MASLWCGNPIRVRWSVPVRGINWLTAVRKVMSGTAFWIVNGRVDNDPFNTTGQDNPEALMQHAGAVFVASGRRGTVIRWAMFASNWSSLYCVSEMLATLPGPYTFEFFLSGWFSQSVTEPQQAVARLQELVVKSDIHLRQKTHVKSVSTDYPGHIPTLIGDTLADRRAAPQSSVDCIYDAESGRFLVERIGSESAVAKYYGTTSPSSFPCQTGNSYDSIVSRAYKKVMESGLMHYGHVLAALPSPMQATKWIGYQRVILPHVFPNGRAGVTVVTEVADVDIKLV